MYRSYRGDVTLLTDLVRCAVRFETPRELLHFVEKWLFVYGQPRPSPEQASLLQLWREKLERFMLVFKQYYSAVPTSDDAQQSASPSVADDAARVVAAQLYTEDAAPDASSQRHKVFEILRIRNRLDPALLDVPGGYRDLALKLKIGFFRCCCCCCCCC